MLTTAATFGSHDLNIIQRDLSLQCFYTNCLRYPLSIEAQSGCQSIKLTLYATEEEDDGIYDLQEVPEDIKNLSSKSPLSGACASSSSTVKLGGQKAKNNKQRQGFGKFYILSGEVGNKYKDLN